MKNTLKITGEWLCAVIAAALIMNLLLAFYNRGTGWIDRTAGSTAAIWTPNSSMLHGTEGRGYHKTDSRGYVNNTDKLTDNYVVAVGSSFTQGKEVRDGERYTDLLNTWLGCTEEAFVYNVSQNAHYFPDEVKSFSALLQEFPEADKIILETVKTSFPHSELADALEQRAYDEMQTGEKILSTLSWGKKLSMKIKEYSPLLFNANSKLKTILELQTAKAPTEQEDIDLKLYEEDLDRIFELMTSAYDGELLILFHPTVSLEEDGSLSVSHEETDDIFRKVCSKYSVTFVDMSEKFLRTYEESHKIPYGFSNTSLGQGHFNADGHRMVAEALLHFLEG